jgi:membrane-bound lytic murein transglycosylase F
MRRMEGGREGSRRRRGLCAAVLVGVALAGIALAGCDAPPPTGAADGERLDLPGIRSRGSLRVLVTRDEVPSGLPRAGWPIEHQRQAIQVLAHDLGLRTEWVYVDRFDALLPALEQGLGDLVVDNLTATPERRARVAFSAPVSTVREQVVTRADDETLAGPADLAGRRVAVRRSSSYWSTLAELDVPGMVVEAAPEELGADEILSGVASGRFDVTLADSNLVAAVLAYRDDLRVAFELGEPVVIAWAMRRDAVRLRQAVDEFLTRTGVSEPVGVRNTDDLPGIRERGVLRVLTRNNAVCYYVWNGQLMGFEYELAREFAKRQGLRLEVIVPPAHGDLLRWLREGRGDVVAASLTATEEREEREDIVFSRRTNEVREMVIARADDPVATIDDLAGRRFAVRRGSHYWQTLTALRDSGVALELEVVPEALETEEVIAGVAAGTFDLTVADSHIADIELTWRDDVRAALALGEPLSLAWAVRRENPKLLAAVNAFFRKEYRGVLYNVLAERYFRTPKRIRDHAESRVRRAGRISPWDEQVREIAQDYGFDWRLLTAQMHQESRFDPQARSFAGALGLMQVMPRTAREMGVDDLRDPTNGILAGVRYLAWMRERFGDDVDPEERIWFSLAAYNVGFGHVDDARRLARKNGWDPDRWFDHTERAILLKRKRAIAARTRFGWCRCSEPVRYVRAVRDRYRAYVQVASAPR